jgi:hypothetical protein
MLESCTQYLSLYRALHSLTIWDWHLSRAEITATAACRAYFDLLERDGSRIREFS